MFYFPAHGRVGECVLAQDFSDLWSPHWTTSCQLTSHLKHTEQSRQQPVQTRELAGGILNNTSTIFQKHFQSTKDLSGKEMVIAHQNHPYIKRLSSLSLKCYRDGYLWCFVSDLLLLSDVATCVMRSCSGDWPQLPGLHSGQQRWERAESSHPCHCHHLHSQPFHPSVIWVGWTTIDTTPPWSLMQHCYSIHHTDHDNWNVSDLVQSQTL